MINAYRNNFKIIAILIFFFSFFLLAYIGTPINAGGDELFKFIAIKEFFESKNIDYFFNIKVYGEYLHHTLRAILYFPTYISFKIFDFQPYFYYIQSYTYSSLIPVFFFLILSRYFKKKNSSAVSLIIFLILIKAHFLTFTQLSADANFLLFNLFLIYFFHRNCIMKDFKKFNWIISGIIFLLIYISRETSIYVIISYSLYLFIISSNNIAFFLKKYFFLFVPLLIYIIFESWLVYKFTGFKLGKLLFALSEYSSHNKFMLNNPTGLIKNNLSEYLISFLDYYKYFGINIFLLIHFSFVCSVFFILKKNKKNIKYFLSFLFLVLYFFQTYFVVSVDPFKFAEIHSEIRFYLFLISLAFLIVIFFIFEIIKFNKLINFINKKKIIVFFVPIFAICITLITNQKIIEKIVKKPNEISIVRSYLNFKDFTKNTKDNIGISIKYYKKYNENIYITTSNFFDLSKYNSLFYSKYNSISAIEDLKNYKIYNYKEKLVFLMENKKSDKVLLIDKNKKHIVKTILVPMKELDEIMGEKIFICTEIVSDTSYNKCK